MATFSNRGFKIVKVENVSSGNQATRQLYAAPTSYDFCFAVFVVRAVRSSVSSSVGNIMIDIYSQANNNILGTFENTNGALANTDSLLLFGDALVSTGSDQVRLCTLDGTKTTPYYNGTNTYNISDSLKIHSGEKVNMRATSAGTYTYWFEVLEYYI